VPIDSRDQSSASDSDEEREPPDPFVLRQRGGADASWDGDPDSDAYPTDERSSGRVDGRSAQYDEVTDDGVGSDDN